MSILLLENHPVFAATVRTEVLGDHYVRILGTAADALDTRDAARFDARFEAHTSRMPSTIILNRNHSKRQKAQQPCTSR